MLEKITYINHVNEILQFGKFPLLVEPSDIHDFAWKITSEYNKISSFEKEITTKTLPVILKCKTRSEGIALRNRMFEIFEKDVLEMQHGKLIIGDYYLKCFVTGSRKTDYMTNRRYMTVELTVETDYPEWVKETKYEYAPDKLIEENIYLDYPLKYQYDYHNGLMQKMIVNDSFMPCNFEIIVHGPCIDPIITIGNQIYEVNIELKESEYMIINSINKKLQKVLEDGTKESAFTYRNRDFYIYKKIPEGVHNVLWNGLFNFSITLFDERSEPKWI